MPNQFIHVHGAGMAKELSTRGNKITPITVVPRKEKKEKISGASRPDWNQPSLSPRNTESPSLGSEKMPKAPAIPKNDAKLQRSESTEESSVSRSASQRVPRFSVSALAKEAEGWDADSDSEASNPKAISFPEMLKTDPRQVKRDVKQEEKAEKAEKKKREAQAASGVRRRTSSPVSPRDWRRSRELLTLDEALDMKKTDLPEPRHVRKSSMSGNHPVVRVIARTPLGGILKLSNDSGNSLRNTVVTTGGAIESPRVSEGARKLRRNATGNESKTPRAQNIGGDATPKAQSPRAVETTNRAAPARIMLSDDEARDFLDCYLQKQIRGMRRPNATGGARTKQSGPQTMFRSNQTIAWKGGEHSLTLLSDYLHQFFAQGVVAQAFQQCIKKLAELEQSDYGYAQDWIVLVNGKRVLADNEDSRALLATVTGSVRGASNTLESSQLPPPVKKFLSYLDERLSLLCAVEQGLSPEAIKTMRHNALAGLLVIHGMSRSLDSITRNSKAEFKELWSCFAAALVKQLNRSDEFFQSVMDRTDAALAQAPVQHSLTNLSHDEHDRLKSQVRSLWTKIRGATLDEAQLGFMRTQLDAMHTILDHPGLLQQAETAAIVTGLREQSAELAARAAPARRRAYSGLPQFVSTASVLPTSNQSTTEQPELAKSSTSSTADVVSSTSSSAGD